MRQSCGGVAAFGEVPAVEVGDQRASGADGFVGVGPESELHAVGPPAFVRLDIRLDPVEHGRAIFELKRGI